MSSEMFKEVDYYIASLLAKEESYLMNVKTRLHQAKLSDQSISAVQGKLLQVLAQSCGAKRVLELGTFGAYSTLWLAGILPSDGKLITIEFDSLHAKIAQESINHSPLSILLN